MARNYERFRARIDKFESMDCTYVCTYICVDIISDTHARITLLWHFIIYNNDVNSDESGYGDCRSIYNKNLETNCPDGSTPVASILWYQRHVHIHVFFFSYVIEL